MATTKPNVLTAENVVGSDAKRVAGPAEKVVYVERCESVLRDGDCMYQGVRARAADDQLRILSVVTQKLQVLLGSQPLLQLAATVRAHVNARHALQ